jgi:hypothetical protein
LFPSIGKIPKQNKAKGCLIIRVSFTNKSLP